MTQPTPLFPNRHPDGPQHWSQPLSTEAPLESPEVLTINALLESGVFNPDSFGLGEQMLAAHHKAWQFCLAHQQQTGRAPTRELFHRSFPEVEIVGGVDIQWAADKLRTQHWERSLRSSMQGAIAAMNDGEWDLAQQVIAEAARPVARARPKGMSFTDPASVAEAGLKVAMPVPYRKLQQVTSGLGFGELWYLAMRLGQGKSFYLPLFAYTAAEAGMKVTVLSSEMSKSQWIHRIHCHHAPDYSHLQRIRSLDPAVRKQAVLDLPPVLGDIEVLDPSDVDMSVRTVRLVAQDSKLVVLDHVGLFKDSAGKKSIEDWRSAASISNELKEIALSAKVGVLAGSQVNREGESANARPPKVSQMSQTDASGQDGDVIIMGKRMGVRAMMLETGKNRNGPDARWYTRFDPKRGDFREIDKDEALQIQIEDATDLGDI